MKLPLLLSLALLLQGFSAAAGTPPNLRQENLAAWCIVPFDAKKRGPEARALMLGELGLTRCAYDWRPEHVEQFEEEILQYQKHGIEFFAFWGGHEKAFELFGKYEIHPQVWKMIPGTKEPDQGKKVQASADLLEPLAKRTAALGCKLGLYNHGGWGGEPENMVAVCTALRARGHSHVGIVYNWHHMHERIGDWPEMLDLMKPYLHCLNLNGMNTGADPKILPLAQGEHDLSLLKTLIASGYDGPVGILDHQGHTDAKLSLQDNLEGLSWLLKEVATPGSGGKKPVPSAAPVAVKADTSPPAGEAVESSGAAFGKALSKGILVEAGDFRRHPPITVECRVKLRDAKGYNILVASDTKASTEHWEIFAMNKSGYLTAYLPGAKPDHITTQHVITDEKWHAVAMHYEADRVRLYLDGAEVADTAITRDSKRKTVKGKLGIGGLVEGRFYLRGAIDEVRIRRGIHEDVTTVSDKPFAPVSEAEGMLWNFDELPTAGPPPLRFPRAPLNPEESPYWEEEINRDRVYDFYAKEALAFGQMKPAERPDFLPPFPGLDGGEHGHWGNQNDKDTWRDGRVREMDHGSIVSGVFRGFELVIPRAVSVQLSDGVNAVFDQETLTFRAAWKGDLVKWSDTRRGFLHGIPAGGKTTVPLEQSITPSDKATYLGLYRNGEDVTFAYEEAGKVHYATAAAAGEKVIVTHSDKAPKSGSPRWSETVSTEIQKGEGKPYAIDTFPLPCENPWKSLFFVGGLDFISENRIAVANIHGDVWLCDRDGDELTWKRFAAGLHQPLGVKVVDGIVHLRCRDQIVALHDLNGDDEADFYECLSDAQTTSAGGHDFITGLQQDNAGRWYFASGNEGLCRVSAKGDKLEVLGTGLRNPNGLGISPDGKTILTSVQEGNWTPASAIADVSVPGHFGAGGPREGERGNVPPMLYLPRGIDNSSGGQTYIESDRWGPAKGQWLHFSGGFAKYFLVLRETFGEGRSQAAAIPLPGEFLSGAHRGRFSPFDGQLYVAGAQGWGNYGVADGSLQRVRYTGGDRYPYPVQHETRDNGLLLTFAEAVPDAYAAKGKWFAQQWDYLYGPGYGSPEYSVNHPGREGHDRLEIRSVHRIGGGKQLFVEMPQLRPADTLHLYFDSGGDGAASHLELFATIHETGPAFTDFPGYERIPKMTVTTAMQGPAMPAASSGIGACVACHHPTRQVVGPSFAEIRKRYAGNPDGIVAWAQNPQNKTPGLPPMPSFQFMEKADLKKIALEILGEE
ncbi:MAG: TIM barrel protein [Verrucomicrobiales bacterium]|nr:TIM barrel protein [Verrucomicrobiales bacterium]